MPATSARRSRRRCPAPRRGEVQLRHASNEPADPRAVSASPPISTRAWPADARIGIAVSGGPDSLASPAAWHAAGPAGSKRQPWIMACAPKAPMKRRWSPNFAPGWRPASHPAADWPEAARSQCSGRGPGDALSAAQRMGDRATAGAVATAHHADDQAETLLMRLLRGAGVGGLGGKPRKRALSEQVLLIRPLLGWRKSDLEALVADAGLSPVDDPSNRDPKHDRSRSANCSARRWLDPARLAASASQSAMRTRRSTGRLRRSLNRGSGGRRRADRRAVRPAPRAQAPAVACRLRRTRRAAAARTRPDARIEALEARRNRVPVGLKLEGGTRWRFSSRRRGSVVAELDGT